MVLRLLLTRKVRITEQNEERVSVLSETIAIHKDREPSPVSHKIRKEAWLMNSQNNMVSTIRSAMQAIKNWMNDPFFTDVYEALRCPDPTEINRIYDRRR